MGSRMYRWIRAVIIVLFFVAPPKAGAQELGGLSTEMRATKDTTLILTLIRRANNIIYTHTDSSLQLLRQAEMLSRSSGYADGVGYALANMGLAMTTMGHFDQGFACYKAALPYCERAKYLKYALPHLYFNMALSWSDKENYTKANEYYHTVLKLVQERMPGNAQFLISVYNNMVAVQINMGSEELAMMYIDKAIQLATANNKKPQLAQILLNKGDIYFTRKQYDTAVYYYKVASKYVDEVNEPHLRQSYYQRMGDVLLEQKKYTQALNYLQNAQKLNDPLTPLMGEIIGGYSLGDALYRNGKYKEAEAVLLAALAKAEKTGLTKNKQNGHAVLMNLYKDQHRYEEAYQQQSKYLELSDSIINLEKIRAVNEIEVKYQVAQKDKALMQNKLMIAQQSKKIYRNNIIIISISAGVLLLVAGGFVFFRYRKKINIRDRKIEQLRAMMAGEEKERVRLSRELHDGLGGMLTGIKLNLRSIQRSPETGAMQENLGGIMTMLQNMGDEIRHAAHNLMPDILLKHRLKEALQLYCEQLDAGDTLKIDLQFMGDFDGLDVTLELQVYRIVQELLQNIIRHAQAGHADIQIRYNKPVLCISVEDDGIGFDTAQRGMGAGLSNIDARIKALHGYCSIEAARGMGTTVFIELNTDQTSIHT
jgi:signal transduction histidine kinase